MGKFSEAIKAGEAAFQALAPAGLVTENVTTDRNAENRALRKVWVDTVLYPVIAEVNEDIKAHNLKFLANVKEDSYSIFVELLFFGYNSTPLNLTITVRNDMDVKIYVMSGQGVDIGTAINPDRAPFETQLVDFLRRQASVHL
jgi:hypothetical protein